MTITGAPYDDITQDQVDAAVRRRFAEHEAATAVAEAAQQVADAAQDRADEFERVASDISRQINGLVAAIRECRPDLTIPEP